MVSEFAHANNEGGKQDYKNTAGETEYPYSLSCFRCASCDEQSAGIND